MLTLSGLKTPGPVSCLPRCPHTTEPIWWNAFANLSGPTGHLIVLFMIVLFATANLKRRIRKILGVRFDGYAVFLQVHKLWVPIYILLFLHSETFWKFCIVVFLFLLLEKYFHERFH